MHSSLFFPKKLNEKNQGASYGPRNTVVTSLIYIKFVKQIVSPTHR